MKRSLTLMVLIGLFLLAFAPAAFSLDLPTTLSLIDDYAMATGLDQGQAALLKTYAIYDPAKLPAQLRIDTPAQNLGWTCATSTIMEIRELAKSATPQIQSTINTYMMGNKSGAVRPSAPKEGKLDNPQGYTTTNNHFTEHFAIRWGSDSDPEHDAYINQAAMEEWGVILEEIWSIQIVDLEFPAVFLSDTYYVDVYVGNSGDEAPEIIDAGAYTTFYFNDDDEQAPGNGQSYFVFDPNSLEEESYIKNMSAHEFFHSIQHTILFMEGGCENYMGPTNKWAYESTATWAQDETYGDSNAYQYQIHGYAAEPWDRLNTQNGIYVYGRVIWWKYVTENFGGFDAVYDLWLDGCHDSLMASTNAVLSNYDTSVDKEMASFAVANLFSEYEEGDLYQSFAIQHEVTAFPTTIVPDPLTKPLLLGTNYIEVTAEATKDNETTLSIQFEGDTVGGGQEDIEWTITLAAMTGENTYDRSTVTVTNGEGAGELEDFGTTYTKLFVILNPTHSDPIFTHGLNYTITFEMASDTPETDDDDATDDDDDDTPNNSSDDNDDDEGCGC